MIEKFSYLQLRLQGLSEELGNPAPFWLIRQEWYGKTAHRLLRD